MSLTTGSEGNSEGKERRGNEGDRKRWRRRAKAIRCEPGCPVLYAPGAAWSPSRPARIWGPGRSASPPRAWHQRSPEGAPRGRAKEGCARLPCSRPPGSASRGPQEEDTLCAALASGSWEGVGGAEPGAAPRSRPRSPGPRPAPRLSAAPSLSHSPAGCVVSAAAAAAAATPAWVMIPSGFRRGVRPPGPISPSAAAACFSGAGGARAQALLSPRPRRLF